MFFMRKCQNDAKKSVGPAFLVAPKRTEIEKSLLSDINLVSKVRSMLKINSYTTLRRTFWKAVKDPNIFG